jgi:hypothetical protein
MSDHDPDRDRYPGHTYPNRYRFQTNDKVDKLVFFPEYFQIRSDSKQEKIIPDPGSSGYEIN